ncbi:hypothetical protein [Variovorax saccharolyticus]|uniref:hypothetical protein n=1 Tax=Variovorax saccharolyticus TaxID=3053516 RepID=UPI002578AC91|nr:hypothetical protein [Variovorax sp. J31P216]MDM0026208.1 hypothetical protein [Variovorax sp. J31P216]
MPSSQFPRLRPLAAVAAAALFVAGNVQAEYLWLQRDGSAATTGRFGEVGKTAQPVASLAAVRASGASGKDLPLTVETDRIVFSSGHDGDLRLTASLSKAAGVLHYYQAKSGRSETRAVNDLELVPTEANGNSFKLMWKGKQVAASQVNVDTSDGWQRVLKPAADGTVTLATPFPGLYVLEVTARVDGAATIEGKKYEDVRHTATLSFEVPR